ncbi:MAG TPA: hypothetical protein VIJ75_16370 [Hanamia sp.]
MYSSGGGSYSLKDNQYTERLEYCSDRQWEGNDFSLTISIHNDTLIQKGIEHVAYAGVDRLNIEKYLRWKYYLVNPQLYYNRKERNGHAEKIAKDICREKWPLEIKRSIR